MMDPLMIHIAYVRIHIEQMWEAMPVHGRTKVESTTVFCLDNIRKIITTLYQNLKLSQMNVFDFNNNSAYQPISARVVNTQTQH